MKKTKKDPYPNTHTARTKYGSGDYYGSGVRQKVGKMVLSTGVDATPTSKVKKPPRTLA
jgi:hypothetical protein